MCIYIFILLFSSNYLNSSWVELNASRGHESYDHKVFMRNAGKLLFVSFVILCLFSLSWLLLVLTRNSSGDEIANVNFLYDDIVHVIQNTIDSCINSTTARLGGYVLERMFTKFSEITQCNGHYAVQGHSRSPTLAPIESSYTTSY